MSKFEKWSIAMVAFRKWSIAMVAFRKWSIVAVVVVILVLVALVTLWNNQQLRQTLCTLRCQCIEDDTAWEACIGECLVEIAND